MQNGSSKGMNIQPVANRMELDPKNRSKPATIRLNNESEFVIEISNEKESKILPTKNLLCFPQYQ